MSASTSPPNRKMPKTYPKQDEDPITLHRKPDQRPPHQNQQYARPKRQATAPFLFACEEEKCSLRAEEERDAYEEEDVAHGKESTVKEEDEAEDEEEATYTLR